MRKSVNNKSRRHAFTLTELLIVMAIVAALATLIVPTLSRAAAMSRSLLCQANLRHLAEAFQTHRSAMTMDLAEAYSVADQCPLHLRSYLSNHSLALLCPEELDPEPYFENVDLFATSDNRWNSWDLHLFDTTPVWEEMAASEISPGTVPGVWKVNEEVFEQLQLSERHNIVDELPRYEPGEEPGVYYYLVEDQRHGPEGQYAGDDMDFEDIIFRIEETYSGTRTISVYSSGSTYCNFDLMSTLTEYLNVKGTDIAMECPGFAGQSYGMNWHADNTRQDYRMALAVDYGIDVVFVGADVLDDEWPRFQMPRHLGKMNVAFTDSSVQAMRAAEIDPTVPGLRRQHWNPPGIRDSSDEP